MGVELRQFDFSDPSAGLAGRQTQVAFIRPPIEQEHDLALQTLLEEPRVAIVASDHPLALEASLDFSALRDEPFIVGPAGTGVWRDFWLVADRRGGLPPRLGPAANTVDEWLENVASGKGVSLAPASVERFYRRPGVTFVPVADIPGTTVAVARRRESVEPAVTAFVDVACEVARDGVGPAPQTSPVTTQLPHDLHLRAVASNDRGSGSRKSRLELAR